MHKLKWISNTAVIHAGKQVFVFSSALPAAATGIAAPIMQLCMSLQSSLCWRVGMAGMPGPWDKPLKCKPPALNCPVCLSSETGMNSRHGHSTVKVWDSQTYNTNSDLLQNALHSLQRLLRGCSEAGWQQTNYRRAWKYLHFLNLTNTLKEKRSSKLSSWSLTGGKSLPFLSAAGKPTWLTSN